MLFILSVTDTLFMLSVLMLIVIILCVIMLSGIMLSVIMLNVTMLDVEASRVLLEMKSLLWTKKKTFFKNEKKKKMKFRRKNI